MPLHSKISEKNQIIGLWHLTENEHQLFDELELSDIDRFQLSKLSNRKQLEWLGSRSLLRNLMEQASPQCLYDEHGKPYVKDSPKEISISHSKKFAAISVGNYSMGIDIQFVTPKIEHLETRFLRPEEGATLDKGQKLEHLTIYWSAKEALYKAYGKRNLDFRKNLIVNPFHLDNENPTFTGQVVKDDNTWTYNLKYQKLDGYVLVYTTSVRHIKNTNLIHE